MTPSPIVVCGLPRSGTSLMMQMLHAAGVPCAGDYPAFEGIDYQRPVDAETVERWRSGAFKLLDPHLHELASGFKYRFLFMTRSRRQQALSQLKMLRDMGIISGTVDDDQCRRHEDSLRTDEGKGLETLRAHEGSVMKIRFEDLISRTAATVNKIAWFLDMDGEAEDAMRRQVRPRAATVYPGMLELELMEHAKAEAAADAPFDPLCCTCHIPPYVVPCGYCANHPNHKHPEA